MDFAGPPNDPPTRLDGVLAEIKRMFERVSLRQEDFASRLHKVEIDKSDMEALRRLQDELRQYVETQNDKQTKAVMQLVEAKIGAIRSGIMTDTEKLLREHLDSWMETKMKPVVGELIKAQDERAKAERTAALRQWRERAALATAIIVLIWAIFDPFKNADDAGDTSRTRSAIESLNDITQ